MMKLALALLSLTALGTYLVISHGAYAGFGLGPIIMAACVVVSCMLSKLLLPKPEGCDKSDADERDA